MEQLRQVVQPDVFTLKALRSIAQGWPPGADYPGSRAQKKRTLKVFRSSGESSAQSLQDCPPVARRLPGLPEKSGNPGLWLRTASQYGPTVAPNFSRASCHPRIHHSHVRARKALVFRRKDGKDNGARAVRRHLSNNTNNSQIPANLHVYLRSIVSTACRPSSRNVSVACKPAKLLRSLPSGSS